MEGMGSSGGDGRMGEKIGRGDGGRVFRRRRWVVEEEMGGGYEWIGGGKCL